MRLLIVGKLDGQLGAASQIAIDKGAKVTHSGDEEAALNTLRTRGADLLMVDVAIDIAGLIEEAEERTRHNERLCLTMALSYGGRQEIVDTARRLAKAAAAGEIDPAAIDEAQFAARLFTHDLPDPDLLIRTSGEQRISNFLLWQLAYSELVFVDRLWPDFNADDLAAAIREYQRRDRRYGAALSSG